MIQSAVLPHADAEMTAPEAARRQWIKPEVTRLDLETAQVTFIP